MSADQDLPPMIGQTLGHYRIVAKIGAGGMGEVYRAHDEQLDRDVALKVLPVGTLADEAVRRQFRGEALALAKLNHPNVETIFEFGTQDGVDFLAMELVPGEALNQRLKAGALKEKEVLNLGTQLAEGLAAAHAQGIVHRDLKPGNLMVTAEGRLKILDFGLAKLLAPSADPDATRSLAETRAAAGTLPYMAPELLRGEKADARSDIWATGAVLYEMCVGRRAFPQATGPMLTEAILHEEPPAPSAVNSKVSEGLQNIILKALDKAPERRYQAAKELAVDLDRLQAGQRVTARVRPAVRRRRALVAMAGLLVAVALSIALNVRGIRERLKGTPSPPRIESLAVLPLELSGDSQKEYLADGMTEELITDLARIQGLKRVIGRSSIMGYKSTKKTPAEIADELDVDALVTGSVLYAGDRVRVTVQLIDPKSKRILWANGYESEQKDVISMQSEIVSAVLREMRVHLTPSEQARLSETRPVNPDAHAAYLRGRAYWNERSGKSLQQAASYFLKAIENDPSFAPAYSGLADCYALFETYGVGEGAVYYPKAKEAAGRALELDPNLAEPHASQGVVLLYYEWDWKGAEQEFRRALEINPSYATARQWYAEYLAAMGRLDEAIAQIREARKSDPRAHVIAGMGAYFHFFARDYDHAVQIAQDVRMDDPGFHMVYGILGRTYAQMGRYREALAAFEAAKKVGAGEGEYRGDEAIVLALSGNRKAAEAKVRTMLLNGNDAVSCAMVDGELGKKDEAFELLERGFQERNDWMVFLKVDPRFDSLRSDPRFADLLRRMNFPP